MSRKVASIETAKTAPPTGGGLQEPLRVAVDLLDEVPWEERFSRFMQHLPGLAWIKDLEGRYVFANEAAFAAFGRSPDELYGKTDHEVFPTETADLFVRNDNFVVRELQGIQTVESLLHPDGVLHQSIVSKFPILNADGAATLVGGMAIDITEQRRAEVAFREKEAELQLLADTTPFVLARCGADLRYKFINKAGAELFNTTPEEMVGRSIFEMMGEEAYSRIESQIDKVLEGRSVEYDAEIPYPAGTRWMRVNYEPERNGDAEIAGWIASILDITEVRHANALVQRDLADMTILRELGALSATAADLDTIYSHVLDAAMRLMRADLGSLQKYDPNRRSLELLAWQGFHPRSAKHWRWIDEDSTIRSELGLPPESRLVIPDVEALDRLAGTDTLDQLRLSGIRAIQSTPLISRSGRIVGVVSTHWREPHQPSERELGFLDLLARQAADLITRYLHEQRLRESDERFRMAQRAGGVGIWDWNIAEGRTYWSETTWDFYGESPDSAEPTDEFWTTHLHPDDRTRVRQNLLDAVASTADTYHDEFRILRADGTSLWIESSGNVTRDDDGQAIRIYGVNIDMTARKSQQEELQHAYDELEQRVAERTGELAESNRALIEEAQARTTAEEQRIQLLHRLVTSQEMERRRIARDLHDQLGQRLTGLRLKLESLRTLVGADGEIAARVDRLQEISEQLDSEVSFLAWELRPTVLDDLGLVEALSTFVQEWSRHAEVEAHFQAIKIGKERFDTSVETHIYRIAQEALNNISKHAKAENVTVMLEKRNKELLLIVEDDGRGFDVSKHTESRKSGRGLGLLGMQERSALIGGVLDIESSKNGTTIYVRVPAFKS